MNGVCRKVVADMAKHSFLKMFKKPTKEKNETGDNNSIMETPVKENKADLISEAKEDSNKVSDSEKKNETQTAQSETEQIQVKQADAKESPVEKVETQNEAAVENVRGTEKEDSEKDKKDAEKQEATAEEKKSEKTEDFAEENGEMSGSGQAENSEGIGKGATINDKFGDKSGEEDKSGKDDKVGKEEESGEAVKVDSEAGDHSKERQDNGAESPVMPKTKKIADYEIVYDDQMPLTGEEAVKEKAVVEIPFSERVSAAPVKVEIKNARVKAPEKEEEKEKPTSVKVIVKDPKGAIRFDKFEGASKADCIRQFFSTAEEVISVSLNVTKTLLLLVADPETSTYPDNLYYVTDDFMPKTELAKGRVLFVRVERTTEHYKTVETMQDVTNDDFFFVRAYVDEFYQKKRRDEYIKRKQ